MGELMNGLQAVNCRYNYHISTNGKCYSDECAMNMDPTLKAKIKLEGCQVFKRKEVQDLRKDSKRR